MADHFNILDTASGGGGVSYRSDGLVAQQGSYAVDANSGTDDLPWIAVLPDSDGNITYSNPNFTVVNSGLYAVSFYGNWSVDDSVETQDRLCSLAMVNYQDPAATSGYAWAQGRINQTLIMANAQNNGDHQFGCDFVTYFLAGDQFKATVTNNDPAEATQLEIVTLSIIRIG